MAHEAQGNLNALNTQAAQMKGAFSSALMPVANDIIPRITDQMGRLTKIIAENADGIKAAGQILAEVVGGVGDAAVTATNKILEMTGAISKAAMSLRELRTENFAPDINKDIVQRYVKDKDIKTLDDLFEKELKRKYKPVEIESIKASPTLPNQLREQLRPTFEELERLKKAAEETGKAIEGASLSWADFSPFGKERNKIEEDPSIIENLRKARKYLEEADTINYKANHTDYENQLRDLQNWRNSMLREVETTAEQREAIEKLYAEKSAQIERDRESKLAEIRESVAALDKSSFENKKASIEKEKAAWIKAGMEQEEAILLSQRKIEQAKKESLEKINSYVKDAASIEYGLTHDAFEKQLYDIEQWKQAQSEKADTAEEVSAIIANAAAKEADAFEKEMDRIKGKIESLQDKIFAQEHSRAEIDMRNAQKQYESYINEGIYPREMVDRWFKNELRDIQKRRLEDTSGNYSKRPLGNSGNYDTGQFIDFNNAVEQSTQSLTELDATTLARKQIEEKIARVGEELDGNFSRANLATANYQDALKSITSGSESAFNQIQSASEQLQQALQNAGLSADDLQNRISATSGDIQSLGDDALKSAQGLESATATFNRAIEMSRLIEEQNRIREQQIETPESKKQYPEIIYGDEGHVYDEKGNLVRVDPSNSMQRWRDAGIEINYADQPDLMQFNNALNNSAANIENFINSTGQVTASMDELITSSEQLRDQAIKTANTPIVPENLPDALNSVGDAGNQAAEKFQQASDTLESVKEKLASIEFQTPQQAQPQPQSNDDTSDIATRALDATSTLGEAIALAGTAKGDPRVALVGAGIQTFADVIQRLRENIEASNQSATDLNQQIQQSAQSLPQSQPADMSGINSAIDAISQKLDNISQRAGEIAQSASKPPQQNINVSPNINVNLGGAYVFDDSMKQQLTDDITSQVANAVTDAVQKATSQANYGYGN